MYTQTTFTCEQYAHQRRYGRSFKYKSLAKNKYLREWNPRRSDEQDARRGHYFFWDSTISKSLSKVI